jgi:predicted metalloprotease with PDZ domain
MAPTTQGNMGHSFLKNFVVTFDWPSRTMYLDPLSEDGSVPPLGEAASAGIAHDGDKVIVTAIARGGPADEAGLTLGETVTHVDGTDIRGISQADFCEVQESKPQTITTESGKTYDAGPITGFFGGG